MKKYISYFIAGFIAFFAMAPQSFAGTLNLVTDKTQFAIGDEFNVDVKIDSEGVGINAAQATVNFPVSVLQEKAADKSNSVFTFWLQEPVADNAAGNISFIGGSGSGLTGKTLQTLRITFKVVGSGTADISFSDGAITASDGNGTNVLSVMKGIQITSITKQEAARIIPAPKIPPIKIIKRPAVPTGKLPIKPVLNIPLYPASDGWYNTIAPFIVHWTLPADVMGVATEINQHPVSDLKSSEGLFDNKTFPSLTDGVWYLHIRFKNDIGWGPFADYKIGIDTAPPLAFEVAQKNDGTTGLMVSEISFETKDQPSGVALYRILVDGNEATTTILSSYLLPPQTPGTHKITVVAEDRAGNKTSTDTAVKVLESAFLSIGTFSLTQFQFFAIIIFVLLALFAAWRYSYRLWEQQLERRIIVAERDVGDTLNIISDDAEKIIKLTKENRINAKDLNEVGFLADKIKDKTNKAKKYIIDNIREISQK